MKVATVRFHPQAHGQADCQREARSLEQVVLGRLNKQIAADLGICEKTVKVHRAHGLKKLDVRSVADLVRLYEKSPRSLLTTTFLNSSAGLRGTS